MIDLKRFKGNTSGSNLKLLRLKDMVANFIVPGMAVVISIGLLNFLTLPKYRQLPQQKTDLEEKLNRLLVLESKRNNLKIIAQNITLLKSDSVKLNHAIEVEKKVPEYFEQLKAVASDTAITSDSISFLSQLLTISNSNEAGQPQPGSEIQISSTLAVPLVKVPVLLTTLETALRLSKITSVSYTIDSSSENVSEGRLNISLSSPYLVSSSSSSDAAAQYSGFDLFDSTYRGFIEKLDKMKDYASKIDAAVSQAQTSSSVQPLFKF